MNVISIPMHRWAVTRSFSARMAYMLDWLEDRLMPLHDLGLLRYSPFVSPLIYLMQYGGSSIFFTAEPCIIIFKNKNAECFGKKTKGVYKYVTEAVGQYIFRLRKSWEAASERMSECNNQRMTSWTSALEVIRHPGTNKCNLFYTVHHAFNDYITLSSYIVIV